METSSLSELAISLALNSLTLYPLIETYEPNSNGTVPYTSEVVVFLQELGKLNPVLTLFELHNDAGNTCRECLLFLTLLVAQYKRTCTDIVQVFHESPDRDCNKDWVQIQHRGKDVLRARYDLIDWRCAILSCLLWLRRPIVIDDSIENFRRFIRRSRSCLAGCLDNVENQIEQNQHSGDIDLPNLSEHIHRYIEMYDGYIETGKFENTRCLCGSVCSTEDEQTRQSLKANWVEIVEREFEKTVSPEIEIGFPAWLLEWREQKQSKMERLRKDIHKIKCYALRGNSFYCAHVHVDQVQISSSRATALGYIEHILYVREERRTTSIFLPTERSEI